MSHLHKHKEYKLQIKGYVLNYISCYHRDIGIFLTRIRKFEIKIKTNLHLNE